MPIFRMYVSEKVLYETTYIEAKDEEEAERLFSVLEGLKKIEVVDSDGKKFETSQVPEVPDSFCLSFTTEEALELIRQVYPFFTLEEPSETT